tara:strand:- start:15619 stop:15990 length:372 start_codon:yes stop_codon:yes gene_type:complete
MPGPTSNTGNTYFNVNECHSFESTHGGTALYSLSSQPASQVTIYNSTAQLVYIYDKNSRVAGAAPSDLKRILIPAAAAATPLQGVTFMGLTNADELSAKHTSTPAETAPLSYRTQFFSSNPSR